MKQLKLKAFYPHLFAIILLILIGFIYFYPTLQGKVVNQSDVSSFVGAAKETIDYRAANNGEEPLWTNSMFSGMPTTMISTYYKGNYLENIYEFLFVGPRPAADLILGFISFYFLMLAFGVNPWLSIVGALAFGLCSYNFQIIQVGHNAKRPLSPLCLLFSRHLFMPFERTDGWEPCCLASRSLSRLWPITRKSHSIWHLLRYSTV